MRRIGSHSLGGFPLAVVRIDCQRCERAGERRKDFSRPCGFTDLVGPPDIMWLVGPACVTVFEGSIVGSVGHYTRALWHMRVGGTLGHTHTLQDRRRQRAG
jgi:hypothetical protein